MAARSLGIALGLFVAASVAGAADPIDPALTHPGSAPSLFNPWIRFYASFDRSSAADLAEGKRHSVRLLGETVLENGRLGKALRLGVGSGGAELAYSNEGNLDLTRPGASSFWIHPLTWREGAASGASGYVRFVRIPGAGRSAFIIERDVRQAGSEREQLIVGFFDLAGGEKHFLSLRANSLWRNGTWHLVVVTWDRTGFAISVDGNPFTRKAVPSGRVPAAFGALPSEATWLVGDTNRESTLIDELTIYSRSLSDAEARRVYEAGLGSDAISAPRAR